MDFYLNQQKQQNKHTYEKGFSFSGKKAWMCADVQVLQGQRSHQHIHGGAYMPY